MSDYLTTEVACPKCGAAKGEPCRSISARAKGELTKGSHAERLGALPVKCGTYTGYQQHRKRGEPCCAACAQARNAYMSRFRQERPKPDAAREAERNKARGRAAWRVAALHPDEFHRLYLEEVSR